MTIRKPAVAGVFYPGDSNTLRSLVNDLLNHATPPAIDAPIIGFVVPHAGYMYSGKTAAHAYRCLTGKDPDVIVIIAPSHRDIFEGISVYNGDGYLTPLGTVPIDKEFREALLQRGSPFAGSTYGHRSEHAIEVQLPFLQTVLDSFSIVPLVIASQDLPTVNRCAELIADACQSLGRTNPVIIASSDLSHYYPYETATAIDAVSVRDIERFDPDVFIHDLETGAVEACGGGPIAAAMKSCRALQADHAVILHHCNSGDTSGDRSGVVGYVSAAFVKESNT